MFGTSLAWWWCFTRGNGMYTNVLVGLWGNATEDRQHKTAFTNIIFLFILDKVTSDILIKKTITNNINIPRNLCYGPPVIMTGHQPRIDPLLHRKFINDKSSVQMISQTIRKNKTKCDQNHTQPRVRQDSKTWGRIMEKQKLQWNGLHIGKKL